MMKNFWQDVFTGTVYSFLSYNTGAVSDFLAFWWRLSLLLPFLNTDVMHIASEEGRRTFCIE